MTYDELKLNDRQILDVLALARREGALPMIHAENDGCIAWLTEILEEAGKIEPRYHADSRPPIIEREAAYRLYRLQNWSKCRFLLYMYPAEELWNRFIKHRREVLMFLLRRARNIFFDSR